MQIKSTKWNFFQTHINFFISAISRIFISQILIHFQQFFQKNKTFFVISTSSFHVVFSSISAFYYVLLSLPFKNKLNISPTSFPHTYYAHIWCKYGKWLSVLRGFSRVGCRFCQKFTRDWKASRTIEMKPSRIIEMKSSRIIEMKSSRIIEMKPSRIIQMKPSRIIEMNLVG